MLKKLMKTQYSFLIIHWKILEKLYNVKRISISKYLNSIYKFLL